MCLDAQQAFTLVVPTYNRSELLRRLLSYLRVQQVGSRILILDSSEAEHFEANRVAVAASGLNIRHERFDPSVQPYAKFAAGMQLVDTKYVSFCADDDILFPEAVRECLDVLEADPFYVAAHGYYINFLDKSEQGGGFRITTTMYESDGLADGDAWRRLRQFMTNYQATFYAVHRTDVLRDVFQRIQPMANLLFLEVLGAALTVVKGGVFRTKSYYMARNTSVPSIATRGWHPFQFLAMDPQAMFAEYVDYRAVLLQALLEDGHVQATYGSEQLVRMLDVLHLRYVGPLMAPHVLDFILEQAQTGVSPEEVNRRLWGQFVFGERPKRRERPYPLPANAGIVRALRRKAVAAAQRLKIGLPARLTAIIEPFTDAVLMAPAADGSMRRYTFHDEFLTQVLPGGRHIQDGDIQRIVNNMGAYV